MITTYFPHITLYDEGTVSLVRELLDAASVGGHRRGSHVAAHHLGFPPPLDLQTAPMETTPPPRPPTLALALLFASSPKKYQRFFDKSKFRFGNVYENRPQELLGETGGSVRSGEGSRHRGGEDGDGTVSDEREDGEQGHPPCHQVCPRGSVRVPIGKAGRTHRDRGRLHPFFSQGREQALTVARGGPRTGKIDRHHEIDRRIVLGLGSDLLRRASGLTDLTSPELPLLLYDRFCVCSLSRMPAHWASRFAGFTRGTR